ncbi:MAG: hypothetical protein M3R51_06780 [Candidatus Eremiobacteraeota bacterium]|nr:hypothetical protein [Candidatus Eremiobacteraeota bacterium]
MKKRRDLRRRAVLSLLHTVCRGGTLAQNALVRECVGVLCAPLVSERRDELAAELPGIIEQLIGRLSCGSEQQQRRLCVLRRSDIAREKHSVIAREIGLSRSQFYRDLHAARTEFAEALEERLSARSIGTAVNEFANDVRVIAIEALRDAGRYEEACERATALARDSDAAGAIRALCMRAALETESGAFARALDSAKEARALLTRLDESRLRNILDATCDSVELEVAHCQGSPGDLRVRAILIDRLRASRSDGDREHAMLLARALVDEGSILFEQDRVLQALASIGEASAIIACERLTDTRLAVDVRIRASGIHALEADRVCAALDETTAIAELGRRRGDVRTLRVGLQMMAAHLLTLGRLDEAKRYASESWALIDLFGSELDRAIVLSNLARIDVHRRDGIAALRWIQIARDSSCDAFSITQALAISEAEAYVLIDQAARAADLTRALNVRVQGWPRLAGRAKLAHAVALSAIGSAREARQCSDEAVELSRGTGGLPLHLRALDLNVRLTGNARSRNALRDLYAALV